MINANMCGLFSSYFSCFSFFGKGIKKCVSYESVSSVASTQSFFIEYIEQTPQIDSVLF